MEYLFQSGQSLKHLIEAAGVPHTEIGEVRVNGAAVGLDILARDGDRVDVFPASARNSQPPPEMRFILDNHLGRLAAYLRMLGFDSLYRNDYQDEELAETAAAQERILLTRDRRLLMRRVVRYGYCLRSLNSSEQLQEVVKRYDLYEEVRPFQRCLRCNGCLKPVSKGEILDRLEPLTRQYFEEFHICPGCHQIYWKGSHYEQMQAWMKQMQDSQPPDLGNPWKL